MKKQKILERLMSIVFFITATISIVSVILILLFIVINSIPALKEIGIVQFITGKTWAPANIPASFGLLPMILGSLYVTAGAVLIGVPLGLFTAVFMARFCPEKLYKVLKPLIDLLAGIPSIVYGFFGLVFIVPLIRNTLGGTGDSILAASILLGIMILPTIIGLSEAAIRAVPQSYYEGALSLGATHERAVFTILLPAAKSGIFASVILGIGRAIGETMAVVMVAGNQARIPTGILNGVRTMTSNIVIEMGYAADLHRGALIASGLVLFVFILILNIAFSLMNKKKGA
ncbi:MAG: phosphate ABC transporter permease subunit PstC [Eubacteriaceae bacterium]|jgi:phosphate transport system permease protein|nr:phosphate ABC transporter permease subunit PstC [Eubacteriaceae bacterium]